MADAKKRTAHARAKIADGNLTMNFKNGSGPDRVLAFDHSQLNADTAHNLMLVGAARVIGQAYSGEDNPYEAAEAAISDLYTGKWHPGRAAGEPKEAGPNDVVLAMAELTGKPIPLVQEVYNSKNKREKGALRQHPQLVPILARMAAERAKAAVKAAKGKSGDDLNALFD